MYLRPREPTQQIQNLQNDNIINCNSCALLKTMSPLSQTTIMPHRVNIFICNTRSANIHIDYICQHQQSQHYHFKGISIRITNIKISIASNQSLHCLVKVMVKYCSTRSYSHVYIWFSRRNISIIYKSSITVVQYTVIHRLNHTELAVE